MIVVPLRLNPGDDLRPALEAWMGRQREQEEQAGCVISGIGSLSVAQLLLAGQQESSTITGGLKILSLVGTLSPDGAHLHIAVADGTGTVFGSHLCAGSLMPTTAELVVGLLPVGSSGGCWIQPPATPSCTPSRFQTAAPDRS
jgi:predicted DNA-binding protein with PD1-like motif